MIFLDGERGEDAAMIGAGVDRDPVRPLVDLRDDGMAVDDDEAMLLGVAEERVAEIGRASCRERV